MLAGNNLYDLAYHSLKSIGNSLGHIVTELAEENSLKKVGLSGGVAFNSIIFKEFKAVIDSSSENLQFLSHRNLPSGDGAIGIGQTGLVLNKIK